ncbi:MAG: hypothetical protein N2484_18270 [Clostridia bacterium]|nr:hypothetical protein [Clostridia bacterium]
MTQEVSANTEEQIIEAEILSNLAARLEETAKELNESIDAFIVD